MYVCVLVCAVSMSAHCLLCGNTFVIPFDWQDSTETPSVNESSNDIITMVTKKRNLFFGEEEDADSQA